MYQIFGNIQAITNLLKYTKEEKNKITFKPLWITLKKKNITTYDLIHHYSMSRGMLDNLKHDRSITLHTLNDLCNTFECDISDIIEYSKDEKEL